MGLINRKQFEYWLNTFLDIVSVNDYLPNGLQVEGSNKISKVATAVSINIGVIDKAVERKAQAIVVHHGLFWKNDDPRITLYRKNRIKALLENDINLFAYHLPLDLHKDISHNRLILKGIGIKEKDIIVPPLGSGLEYGLVGAFENPINFTEVITRLDNVLETNSKYFNYGKHNIKKIAVVSGAGRTLLDKVINMDIDAYITGDAQENTEYISKEMGINYIYAGHYNTEKPGIIALGEKVKKEFDIDVEFVKQDNPL